MFLKHVSSCVPLWRLFGDRIEQGGLLSSMQLIQFQPLALCVAHWVLPKVISKCRANHRPWVSLGMSPKQNRRNICLLRGKGLQVFSLHTVIYKVKSCYSPTFDIFYWHFRKITLEKTTCIWILKKSFLVLFCHCQRHQAQGGLRWAWRMKLQPSLSTHWVCVPGILLSLSTYTEFMGVFLLWVYILKWVVSLSRQWKLFHANLFANFRFETYFHIAAFFMVVLVLFLFGFLLSSQLYLCISL